MTDEQSVQEQPTHHFTRVIDGKTYIVGIHFAEKGETFQTKYERMLREHVRKECSTNRHTADTANGGSSNHA